MGDGVQIDSAYERLAPALAILRPLHAGTLTLELVGEKGDVLAKYTQAVSGRRVSPPRGTVHSEGETMTVTLTRRAPAEAFVLVVFERTADGPIGLAWSRVGPGQRRFEFEAAARCEVGPMVARPGSWVQLAWFDMHGRRVTGRLIRVR